MNSQWNQYNWNVEGLPNPTPVGEGGRFPSPNQKISITPKNNDPKKQFIYIFDKPSHTLSRLKMAKKGVSIAFLLLVLPISGS